MRKLLVGAFAGGLIVFAWGLISHMALPLGHVGVKSLDPLKDTVLVAGLGAAVDEPGLYMFPRFSEDMSDEEQQRYVERIETGPSGLLVYHPRGRTAVTPAKLAVEFVCDALGALVLAWILLKLPRDVGYGARVLIAGAAGLFAFVGADAQYWNWWGFPGDYTFAQLVMDVVGWLLAGLALGRLCRH